MATKLTRLLKKLSNSHCTKAMINKGNLVHTMSCEKADTHVNEYLRDYTTMDSEEFYLSIVGRRTMFQGVLYTINDNVVVTPNNIEETPWKARIKGFIYQ